MAGNFLKAEWKKLAMANYSIDKKLLNDYLPAKTEVDLWNNTCYLSLVGFMFLNTKIKGIKIPFHANFEEVNLRFYVRFNDKSEWKRGVVFIKEIVPKPALTFVANTIYKENYETMRMNHRWEKKNGCLHVGYNWKKEKWNSLNVTAEDRLENIEEGSEEEFITEHYWGYTKTRNGTSEYQVEHPRWQVYPVKSFQIDVDFGFLYGKEFDFLQNKKPKSVFLAEGSDVKVNNGIKI